MTIYLYSDGHRKGTIYDATLDAAREIIAAGEYQVYVSDKGKLLYSANQTGRVTGTQQQKFL